MPRRFVDLSVALESGIVSDPPIMLPEITYMSHADTAEQVMSFFPGLKREDLPGGEGWAVETLQIATHNGTHLDAPYHGPVAELCRSFNRILCAKGERLWERNVQQNLDMKRSGLH